MTTDAYWDELGIAWIAAEPDLAVLTPGLKTKLSRQSLWVGAGSISAAVLSIAGLILGPLTIWIGSTTGAWHFIVRGIAIIVVAALMAASARALSSVRAADHALALPDLLDLSIGRAARTLLVIRLALLGCVVAGILGVTGAAIRIALVGPPALSPLIDLTLLVLLAAGLSLYRREVREDLAKFEYLQRTLAEGDGHDH